MDNGPDFSVQYVIHSNNMLDPTVNWFRQMILVPLPFARLIAIMKCDQMRLKFEDTKVSSCNYILNEAYQSSITQDFLNQLM